MGHPEIKDPAGNPGQPNPDTNPDHKPLEAPGHDGDRNPGEKREIEEPPAPDKPAKSMEQEAADHEVELRKAKRGGEEVIETAPPLSAVRTPPD